MVKLIRGKDLQRFTDREIVRALSTELSICFLCWISGSLLCKITLYQLKEM